MRNKSRIPTYTQLALLKRSYPDSVSHSFPNGFDWKCNLQPTPNSLVYRIKICYRLDKRISVYVITPKKLPLANGETSLPHVFSTERQQLCLFYKEEFRENMRVVDTIVPWASEWLFYYEIWYITGSWEGGGIHIKKGDRLPIRKEK